MFLSLLRDKESNFKGEISIGKWKTPSSFLPVSLFSSFLCFLFTVSVTVNCKCYHVAGKHVQAG